MLLTKGESMYKLVPPDQMPLSNDVEENEEGLAKAYKICVGLSILCVKEGGIGLSAAQVGIPSKIFVVKSDLHSQDYRGGFSYYINCNYTPIGDERYESLEGCLSLVDKRGELRYFIVPRPLKINFTGKRLYAGNPLLLQPFDKEIDKNHGLAVFSHETDHCYGITIDQIGVEQGIISSKNRKKK